MYPIDPFSYSDYIKTSVFTYTAGDPINKNDLSAVKSNSVTLHIPVERSNETFIEGGLGVGIIALRGLELTVNASATPDKVTFKSGIFKYSETGKEPIPYN